MLLDPLLISGLTESHLAVSDRVIRNIRHLSEAAAHGDNIMVSMASCIPASVTPLTIFRSLHIVTHGCSHVTRTTDAK